MRIALTNENTWLYPDTFPEDTAKPYLETARGAHAAFCARVDGLGATASVRAELPDGVSAEVSFLTPTHVEANSGKDLMIAENYEEVADFVTRKAPFELLEVLRPMKGGDNEAVPEGAGGFFVTLYAQPDAVPGEYEIAFTFTSENESIRRELTLKVWKTTIPSLAETDAITVNWMSYAELARVYDAPIGSEKFWKILDAYMDDQLRLRSNHLRMPSGDPIRDENGKVIDFDFSLCEEMARRAIAKGYARVNGGFVARFTKWDNNGQYLLWDREIEVCTQEAYRQLKIYFTKLQKMIDKNGFGPHWIQCLVDEPQFPNSISYRVLSDICRACMPGVTIHDPVETTDVPGGTDIWNVKQAVFDKYRDTFKQYQAMGERMTCYTCGWPAGYWMNRVMDLPVLSGRLTYWMAAREHMEGFLHWGWCSWGGNDPFRIACCPEYTEGYERWMPPGNGFVVYPGEDGPLDSVRSMSQLFACEDFEVLRRLPDEDIDRITGRMCRDFHDYDTDPEKFAAVRHEMFVCADR